MPIGSLAAATCRSAAATSGLPPSRAEGIPIVDTGGGAWFGTAGIDRSEGGLPVSTAIACSNWDRCTPRSTNCARAVSNCVDRKSTRLNSSHANISYAVFCLKKRKKIEPLPMLAPLLACLLHSSVLPRAQAVYRGVQSHVCHPQQCCVLDYIFFFFFMMRGPTESPPFPPPALPPI